MSAGWTRLILGHIWKEAGLEQALEIPLGAHLRFEIPKYPSLRFQLVLIDLSFNITTGSVLQCLVPGTDIVNVAARPSSGGTSNRVRALPSRSTFIAIQVFRAIGHGARPLSNNCPVVSFGRVRGGVGTYRWYPIIGFLIYQVFRKNLILVVINDHTLARFRESPIL